MTGLEYMKAIVDGSHPPDVRGGEAYSTLETKFNLVRAITPEAGEVLAEGSVVHRGRRVATAEGFVRRASDAKLFAHGTSTCMIL